MNLHTASTTFLHSSLGVDASTFAQIIDFPISHSRDGLEAEFKELVDRFVAYCGNSHLILNTYKQRRWLEILGLGTRD